MLKKLLMAAAATVAMSGAASALTITSATADCAAGNTPPSGVVCGTSDRRDLGAVELGERVGNDFFSLGLGGEAIFYIDPDFMSPGTAIEVTNGRETYYPEEALVFGGIDGENFVEIGRVSNQSATSTFNFTGTFNTLRFLDITTVPDDWTGGGNDGYDLAAFTVAPVPLPAGGLLLLGGLGALGVASRRRRKSA